MIEAIVVLAIIIIILQMGLSIYQVRYYEKFIRHLVKKYSKQEGYSLHTDNAKNILRNVMVVIVADENKRIIEAFELKGNTIFSKFQPIKILENQIVNLELIEDYNKEKKVLSSQAIVKILKKI